MFIYDRVLIFFLICQGCEEESTETPVETTTLVPGDCANSTYGCCPDGQKAANGTNFAGCGVINTKNCTASYFGCCPDNVTAGNLDFLIYCFMNFLNNHFSK